jgi:LysM repeat protein
MGLERAKIHVLDKGATTEGGGKLPRTIDVQFNPTEYTRNKGTQIAEIGIPGLDSPLLQFVRGQNEKLAMDLFFDTTTNEDGTKINMGDDARSVTKLTGPVYQLAKVQSETHAPPRVRFSWSSDLDFTGVVESVQQKFALFNPKGVPLRATLSVTFREHKHLDQQLEELNLKSPDTTKSWVVRRGDTLSNIAARAYQDPTVWRAIARHPSNAGKVANPRRPIPGTVLEIPVLDNFAAAREGRP